MSLDSDKIKKLASEYDVLCGTYSNWLTKSQFISLFRSKNQHYLDLFFFKEDFLLESDERVLAAGTSSSFTYYREPIGLYKAALVTRRIYYIRHSSSKYRYDYFDTKTERKSSLNLYFYKRTWLAKLVAAE